MSFSIRISGKRRLLGQRQLIPELLQMRGHDRPSEGLRPPCGVSSLTLSVIATAASTQPHDALNRFGVVRHDKAGVLLFDCPRRRDWSSVAARPLFKLVRGGRQVALVSSPRLPRPAFGEEIREKGNKIITIGFYRRCSASRRSSC
jgi:hypothetical protein